MWQLLVCSIQTYGGETGTVIMTSMFILKEEEWGKGTDRNSWAVGTFNVSWEYISAAPYPEDLVLLLGRLPQSILFFFFFYHPWLCPLRASLPFAAISISPARIIAESCTSLFHISLPGQVSCALPNSSAWRCAVFSFVWKKIGNMSEKYSYSTIDDSVFY